MNTCKNCNKSFDKKTVYCSLVCRNESYSKDPRRKKGHLTHGLSKTKLYGVWTGMKDRCYREKANGYENYGGRGIKVCDRWMEYTNFHIDMASSYKEGLTLERLDVNGNYSPENCIWADRIVQNNNRRDNKLIEYNGEKLNIKQWGLKLKMKPNTLALRLSIGWSVKRTFTEPIMKKTFLKSRNLSFKNSLAKEAWRLYSEENLSVKRVCKQLGISASGYYRLFK